ncbi:MAG: FkbM family methyltransferase [Propionibacteriales bacterium]|nr:FkbM family methyltransferase [Propionibacteriales bacterium]
MKRRAVNTALMAAYKRGFEIRRHPAGRRQKMFASRGVDLVLDVGGADGGYGRALRQFGYAGRIVSFEPLAASYAELSRNIAADPRWTARNHALGDAAGEAQIHVASNSTSSSLLPMKDSHREADPRVGIVGQETIRVERLDDAAAEIVGTADTVFLKIDTQGFERQVLAGGPETVARSVGLQLELSFVPLYEGGMLADEAISMAYAAGFHLEVIESGWASQTGQMLQADGIFFRD